MGLHPPGQQRGGAGVARVNSFLWPPLSASVGGLRMVAGPLWDPLVLIHNPFLPKIQAAPGGSHGNSTPGEDQLEEKPDFTVKKKKKNWPEATGRASWDRGSAVGLILRRKTAKVWARALC